ncbi:signal recognition particle-docking protein FtsY [Zhaonella formicivorans]|uniref:signal recognition particle-docking protein FtsY n=1 Tax=Zhaonella formicivorans TaxID=2528593 RepID=UPI0010F16132|nr:signal recognition particle-docking protein FtsY [Zhaonella formicivorans]
MGLIDRLKEGLAKTRQGLVDKVTELVTGYKKLDEDFYEELEALLIQADVGVQGAIKLVDNLREKARIHKAETPDAVKAILKEEIAAMLGSNSEPLNLPAPGPAVIMVVGVNGVGKTTTIGKLAYKLKQEGKKVLLVAGDTFRAAAIDQLEIWANRVGAELIKHQEGADPAAVAFDGIQAAKSRQVDVVLIDTAGRLHNKVNLMEEVRKVRRVIERELPGAPHEVLLVLDATTGQNAVAQAKLFGEATGVTAIALTKLDGTAKGGVIIAVSSQLDIPVKLVGIGEKIDDLKDFNSHEFVEALFA